MNRPLRQWATAVITVAGITSGGAALAADDYPSQTVRWLVPYNAGGASDVVARLLAEKLGSELGGDVIVENRPGGATTVAMRALHRAAPDGYTIATADNAHLYNNWAMFNDLPYEIDDFDYITMTGSFPLVLGVSSTLPVETFAEWVAWAKEQNGAANYASPGVGSPHHIAMATLVDRLDLDMSHIPYRGDSAAVVDVASGNVGTMLTGVVTANQFKDDDRIRFLAVTWPERLESLPNVPTFDEVEIDNFAGAAEQGVIAPSGLPDDVRNRLNQALGEILESDEIRAQLATMGMYPTPGTPAAFREHVEKQAEVYGEVIERNNITVE